MSTAGARNWTATHTADSGPMRASRQHLEWDDPLPALRHSDCGGPLDVGVVCRECSESVDPADGVAMPDGLTRTPGP